MDSNKKNKKKFDFKQKKDCAIKSIAEVNCFLLNLWYNSTRNVT